MEFIPTYQKANGLMPLMEILESDDTTPFPMDYS